MNTDHDLTSLTISMTEAQMEFLRKRASEFGCNTPSEFVQRLIAANQVGMEQEKPVAVQADPNAGLSAEMTDEDWAYIKREVAKGVEAHLGNEQEREARNGQELWFRNLMVRLRRHLPWRLG